MPQRTDCRSKKVGHWARGYPSFRLYGWVFYITCYVDITELTCHRATIHNERKKSSKRDATVYGMTSVSSSAKAPFYARLLVVSRDFLDRKITKHHFGEKVEEIDSAAKSHKTVPKNARKWWRYSSSSVIIVIVSFPALFRYHSQDILVWSSMSRHLRVGSVC